MKTVRPMHMQFVEPSKRHADLIVPEGVNQVAVEMVSTHISKLHERGTSAKLSLK